MHRQLSCMFCDDIRLEVGNKFSMMGIYQAKMVVPCFPFELRRLFVSLKATAPDTDEFKALKFVIMHDDDVIHEINIDPEAFLQTSPEFPVFKNVTDARGVQIFQTFIELQGTRFEHPGMIRTRIITERETIAGDGLVVIEAPTNQ